MIQQLLVGMTFLAAIGFLAVMMVRSFRATKGCASGCGKCNESTGVGPVRPRF